MPPLSAACRALLIDIAAAYGVAPVEPDADGLIRIDIDDQPIALAFGEAWGSVFLSTVLALDAAEALGADVYRAFGVQARLAGSTTRIARVPRSGALILVAELDLAALRYPELARAISVFLADTRRARADLGLPLLRA